MIGALVVVLFLPIGLAVAARPALIAPVAVLVTQSVTNTWALANLAFLAAAGLVARVRAVR